ncbi:hypothetical protein RchiOBHm_Chr1g0343151 [Rosa chinensis]|uniref:Uncharacterized protein n=1 Tax=Rosa chinensis TaxID=74649 RepID=A0A2P6SE68_ROSCH|nr:hypothetical protein RchiOBHm_Chr1g0343151 [Rosa chinensis]
MILIPYGIAGGLHHWRTAKEKVQIVESLTLFLLAFFLSSAALPLLLPGVPGVLSFQPDKSYDSDNKNYGGFTLS